MKKSVKIKNKVNNNFELLTRYYQTNPSFIARIENLRKKIKKVIKAPISTAYINPTDNNKDFQLIVKNKPDNKTDRLVKSEISQIMEDFNLPRNFNVSLIYLIVYGIITPPAYNFDNKIQDFNQGIYSTILYAPLTKKEQEMRRCNEKKIEGIIQNTKVKIIKKGSNNYLRDIAIYKDMMKRGIWKEEVLDSYLSGVKKQYSQEVFEKTKKLNPGRVGNKITKYTSQDIAKHYFCSKKQSVKARKIRERTAAKAML